MIQPGQVLYGLEGFRGDEFVHYPGGVPLKDGGTLIGGLAVSGGSLEQDDELARAGVAAALA